MSDALPEYIQTDDGALWIPQALWHGDVLDMLKHHFGDHDVTVDAIWVRQTVAPPPEERWDGESALGRDPKTGRFKAIPWFEECRDETWKGAQPWWSVRYPRRT